jgi:hypothetical protein
MIKLIKEICCGKLYRDPTQTNRHGLHLSVIVPEMRVADVDFNCREILRALEQSAAQSSAPAPGALPRTLPDGCTCGEFISAAAAGGKRFESPRARCGKLPQPGNWALVGLPFGT